MPLTQLNADVMLDTAPRASSTGRHILIQRLSLKFPRTHGLPRILAPFKTFAKILFSGEFPAIFTGKKHNST